MWGVVKKCAGYRRKSSINGSMCKLCKCFLLGLLTVFWLDLCSLLALLWREQKWSWQLLLTLPKQSNLWVTAVSYVQTGGTWLIRTLCPGFSRTTSEERTWNRFPSSCNIAATHLAFFCHWRLGKYCFHPTFGRWAALDNKAVCKLCVWVYSCFCCWNLLRQRSKSLGTLTAILLSSSVGWVDNVCAKTAFGASLLLW